MSANPWSLRDEYPVRYLDWQYEVRDGTTLMGFAAWLNDRLAEKESYEPQQA